MTARPAAATGSRTRAIAVVAWILLVLLAVVLLAELGTRLVTWGIWRIELQRWPELAERIEFTRAIFTPRFTKETVLEDPEKYPGPIFHRDGRVSWNTFGELPVEAFRSPPEHDQTAPGVVRVAFFGGSTTFNEYPEAVGERFDERFGPGRVEVLNLGVPSSSSWTSLVLMRRYLPRWKPHIAVLYQGFNDQAHHLGRVRALIADAGGAEFNLAPSPARGLWSLLHPPPTPDRTRFEEILEQGLQDHAEDAWWGMARTTWANGADFVLSTFATPAYDEIPADERAYYEAEFKYVFPWMGGVEDYSERIERHAQRIRLVARLAGLPVIDVGAEIAGGREIFQDNCHLNEEGRYRQSKVVAAALADRVGELLAAGAPAPAAPAPALATVTSGTLGRAGSAPCERGPCPAGACLVKPGRARIGYTAAQQDDVAAEVRGALGLPPYWYADPRPVEEWEHGPFCIDRTERSRADRAACVAAGSCPPFLEAPDPDLPAALPTALEARALCHYFGGRLPSEREWEAGARGGDDRLLPWGKGWTGTEANLCGRECPFGIPSSPDDGAPGVSEKGSFSGASPVGPVDTAGNLAEWVVSCDAGTCSEWLRGGSFLSPPGLLWRRKPDGLGDTAPRLRGVRCAYDLPPGT